MDALSRSSHRYVARRGSTVPSSRVGTRGYRTRGGVALLGLVVALVAVACIPQDEGDSSEVREEASARGAAPEFPKTGRVPDDLLVEGLVWDFTDAPSDLNLWVPSAAEARCAAEKIVANVGVRISDLGYLPDTSGASLNDIALNEFERKTVATLFESCVDAHAATAALILGRANMDPEDAACMADGLVEAGVFSKLIESWALGRQADPFEDDAAFASALLANANVCLPGTSFFWFDVDLPGDEDVTGVQEGAGTDSGEDLPGSAGNQSTTTSTPAIDSTQGGNTGEP